MEAADKKLLKAAEGTDQLPVFAIWEAAHNARLFARMLEDVVTAGTTLPRRVFNALESNENRDARDARNPSHIEGGILTLTLVERSRDEAMTLIQQFDGDEVDAAFEVALAVRGTQLRHDVVASGSQL